MHAIMNAITELFHLSGLIDGAHAFFAFLLLLLAVLVAVYKRAHFVGACLFPEYRFSWLRGLVHLLQVLHWYLLKYPFAMEPATILVEIEILNPRNPRPIKSAEDNVPDNYGDRLRTWRHDEKVWRKDVRNKLRLLLSRNEGHASGESAENLIIPFDLSRHSVDEFREKISRYFSVRAKVFANKKRARSHFVALVRFSDVFLGPQHLIHGIMSRFNEEWSLVIDNYQNQIKASEKDHVFDPSLDELRAFQLSCWLMWGPSIPLCQCDQWNTGATRYTGETVESSPVAFQCGYGDEDNSIDLLVRGLGRRDYRESLAAQFEPYRAATDTSHVRAINVDLTAKIGWGPNYPAEEICRAQFAIRGGNSSGMDGRVVLELVDLPIASNRAANSRNYFSAYVWIMLFLRRKDGDRNIPVYAETWKNLLPFFEHGNIADATTYLTFKRTLATKVHWQIKEILANPKNKNICLEVVCASDQSVCGDRRGNYFLPFDLDELIIETLRAQVIDDPQTKCYLMEQRLLLPAQPTYTVDRGFRELKIPDTPSSLPSCHLPEVVDQFLAELKQ